MMSSVQPPTAPPKKNAYWIQAQVFSGIAVHHRVKGLVTGLDLNLQGVDQSVDFLTVA